MGPPTSDEQTWNLETLGKAVDEPSIRGKNIYCCHGHVEEDATERPFNTSAQLSRAKPAATIEATPTAAPIQSTPSSQTLWTPSHLAATKPGQLS